MAKSSAKVAKKTGKRVKHMPQRTCVGCRQTLAKRSLIRVVRTAEGVRVDPTGKAAGRGAYLHDRRSCWEQGIKGALAHALKTELSDEDKAALRAFMNTLPEDTAEENSGASLVPETQANDASLESKRASRKAESAKTMPGEDHAHKPQSAQDPGVSEGTLAQRESSSKQNVGVSDMTS